MSKRYGVDGEKIRFRVDDRAESILIELSRAAAGSDGSCSPGVVVRTSSARSLRAGQGRSSSLSHAAAGPSGSTAEAAATGIRRHRFRLSD